MSKIFVSTPDLPESAVDMLREAGDVRVWEGEGLVPREDLLAGLADAEALVCLLSERVDAEALDAAPRLRVVANVAVGYNNVDVAAAAARGVLVTNTPDVLTDATADLAFALVLSTARRTGEAERALRAGGFTGWSYRAYLGMELRGKTLGVLGYGRIGRAVGARAEAFGMRVRGLGSRATAEEIDALVSESDVLSLHVPLTDATRHMLDARRIALLRPTAVVVNTARGPVVDEAALAEALVAGRIAGVGLDVFEEEPRVHPRLFDAPNAVLLPHVGSATREARTAMAELAARNAVEALAGRRPPNVVAG